MEVLGDENAGDLASMIKGNTCCTKLDVIANKFSDNSYFTILSGLKENETLEELSLM